MVHNGAVVGVRTEYEGRNFCVKGNKGVLLASGGYEWNDELHRRFVPGPPVHPHTPPGNEGDGHIMGMEIGAAIALMDTSIWAPFNSHPGRGV